MASYWPCLKNVARFLVNHRFIQTLLILYFNQHRDYSNYSFTIPKLYETHQNLFLFLKHDAFNLTNYLSITFKRMIHCLFLKLSSYIARSL